MSYFFIFELFSNWLIIDRWKRHNAYTSSSSSTSAAEVLSDSLPELLVPVSKFKIEIMERVIFVTGLGFNRVLDYPILACFSRFPNSLPNLVAALLSIGSVLWNKTFSQTRMANKRRVWSSNFKPLSFRSLMQSSEASSLVVIHGQIVFDAKA